MSDQRPYTSIGLPRREPFRQPELRRISLDPNMIRAAQEPQVPPHTPVPGVGYSTVGKVEMQLDSGAKVIAAVRRALELHTGHVIDDETLPTTINVIIEEDVCTVLPFDGVSLTFQMKGRSFGALTQKDMPLLYTYYAGTIEFN